MPPGRRGLWSPVVHVQRHSDNVGRVACARLWDSAVGETAGASEPPYSMRMRECGFAEEWRRIRADSARRGGCNHVTHEIVFLNTFTERINCFSEK